MKILTFLMIGMCFGQLMIAQDTEIVVIYADNGAQKMVFNINNETNRLVLTEKPSTTADNFFDAFIIKPSIENPNSVYIVAAKENNLFLKRDGDALEFSNIQDETTAGDRESYEWEIQYLGFPFITVNDPTNEKRVIYMQNNELIMKVVPDINWDLSNNEDTKANAYRYKINKIKNTF